MEKFIPQLFKTYKILTNTGWKYRIYYKYNESTDVYYHLSIESQDLYIEKGHEFKKFLALRGDDHTTGKINSKQAQEIIYYIFTYLGET